MRLEKVDNDNQDDDDEQRHHNRVESDGTSQGEAENEDGEEEKHGDQVKDCKPPIFGGCVAQNTCQSNWPAHPGDGIEDKDSGDVEDEMNQGYLDSLFLVSAVCCQAG